jgi:3-methylcrotonyl-CoA carboxylase beta subunit
MPALATKINPRSEEFKACAAAMRALVDDLNARLARIAQGGGDGPRAKHLARGKLLPRDRVEMLLDPDTPFLELAPLAALDMYANDAPGAGLIAGIGRVCGVECMVVCNDATVKGGTYYPMTVKKHLRAQEIAQQNQLPCIYLVDSGGANLPNQDEVFPDRDHFGRIFYNQAQMSAQGIPQIAVVMGSCTAGGAYMPAMSDESIIVKEQGTIFLGGPPLVKAATGEVVSAEDLGGADVHTRLSGVADHLARGRHACAGAGACRGRPAEPDQAARDALMPPRAPLYPADELHGIIPTDTRKPFDVREIIARIVDGSEFDEFKAALRHHAGAASPASRACRSASSPTTASCSARAPSRARTSSSCAASARCRWCSCRTSPASWSAASTRTRASPSTAPRWSPPCPPWRGAQVHRDHRRQLRRRQLRHVRPRLLAALLWMWPNARISVMGGEQAASVLATVRRDGIEAKGGAWSADEEAAFKRPILEQFEHQAHPYYASARLWDDGRM